MHVGVVADGRDFAILPFCMSLLLGYYLLPGGDALVKAQVNEPGEYVHDENSPAELEGVETKMDELFTAMKLLQQSWRDWN